MARVCVVGLGAMGLPIATLIARGGHSVAGHDVRPDALHDAVGRGLTASSSLADVAADADVLLTFLPSDAALDDVVEGLRDVARSGAVLAECSTLSLGAKERARSSLGARDVAMLDCPLSGTAHQARTGDLVAYLSGDAHVSARAEPVLTTFTREVRHVGPFGAGTRLKLVANLLVAIHNVAAAEALVLGVRAGIDPEVLLGALTAGAGTSRMLEVRGPMMLERRFADASMTIDLFAKDLSLIEDLAASLGSATPLLDVVVRLYADARLAGRRTEDTAAVIDLLEQLPRRG